MSVFFYNMKSLYVEFITCAWEKVINSGKKIKKKRISNKVNVEKLLLQSDAVREHFFNKISLENENFTSSIKKSLKEYQKYINILQ